MSDTSVVVRDSTNTSRLIRHFENEINGDTVLTQAVTIVGQDAQASAPVVVEQSTLGRAGFLAAIGVTRRRGKLFGRRGFP